MSTHWPFPKKSCALVPIRKSVTFHCTAIPGQIQVVPVGFASDEEFVQWLSQELTMGESHPVTAQLRQAMQKLSVDAAPSVDHVYPIDQGAELVDSQQSSNPKPTLLESDTLNELEDLRKQVANLHSRLVEILDKSKS